jgi:hypothetical protein
MDIDVSVLTHADGELFVLCSSTSNVGVEGIDSLSIGEYKRMFPESLCNT